MHTEVCGYSDGGLSDIRIQWPFLAPSLNWKSSDPVTFGFSDVFAVPRGCHCDSKLLYHGCRSEEKYLWACIILLPRAAADRRNISFRSRITSSLWWIMIVWMKFKHFSSLRCSSAQTKADKLRIGNEISFLWVVNPICPPKFIWGHD